ncbi:MAG: hypothetical protein M3071_03505 [Actinomycetota bacterium]|nr:hypothetical protein [Actinomycetota bacterium]
MVSQLALDPEAYWRSSGWGPEWRFPATRLDGEPLELSLRVPLAWEAFDVMKRPVGAATMTGPLARAVAPLAQGIEAAGVIAIIGIDHALPLEGADDAHLFVTLTVALADVTGAIPEYFPGAQVEPVEFGHPDGSYRGLRIRRIKEAAVTPDGHPVPLLAVQYMVRTEHGVLAIAFATPQVEVFEALDELLVKIAGTCTLTPVL